VNAEIVKQRPAEVERQHEPVSVMDAIVRAASDPNIDIAKMSALVEMQFRIEARQAEIEFNAALARLMPKMPRVRKDGTIPDNEGRPRSRFATYEEIDRVTRPLLADEGFSISFRTEDPTPGHLRVIGTLSHRMGHSKDSSITLPITAPPRATATQGVGSTDKYGRRYVILNMLNIVCEGVDNDGQGDPQPIGAEQVMTLETLLQDSKADRKKFLAWARVNKLEDIQEGDYPDALKALQAALRAHQKAAK